MSKIRFILICIVPCLLSACAGTSVDEKGMRTQGNSQYVSYKRSSSGAVEFVSYGLNHSTPTRAGAQYIREIGAIALPAISAMSGGAPALATGANALPAVISAVQKNP